MCQNYNFVSKVKTYTAKNIEFPILDQTGSKPIERTLSIPLLRLISVRFPSISISF